MNTLVFVYLLLLLNPKKRKPEVSFKLECASGGASTPPQEYISAFGIVARVRIKL